MRLISDPAEMRKIAAQLLADGALGFVPTMGALHRGHMSLVTASRARDRHTVASIFVNPKQFGPTEDFGRYPRQFDADSALLADVGVEALFTPAIEAMYPAGFSTKVSVEGLNSKLCGASRPGHFDGVTTVVAKLFNIVQPTRAYFGQKDAAQVAVLRRLARDLNFDIELVICPIVRDPDGLALSSRNAYLTREQRHAALSLSRALNQARADIEAGERDAERLRRKVIDTLSANIDLRPDYVEVVDADNLLARKTVEPNTLIALAAFVDGTRLIDNLLVDAAFRVLM
jgi:pantoate--beta-alanine ligase